MVLLYLCKTLHPIYFIYHHITLTHQPICECVHSERKQHMPIFTTRILTGHKKIYMSKTGSINNWYHKIWSVQVQNSDAFKTQKPRILNLY
jgi:hypothetical protein